MTSISVEILQREARKKSPAVELFHADPSRFYFEERVRMSCFYCKNYNLNWKCPPRIPEIDYQKMMQEFQFGAFVKIELPFNESNFQDIRSQTTNDLHQILLYLERFLWNHDYPMALSFLGGSCKLCKGGCGKERCNNPYLARVPLEATGVNVIKTVEEQTGIHLQFPPEETLKRVGLLLW